MKTCSVCQTSFPDDVELFPMLIVTRDERVARELMEVPQDEVMMACMKCWFADVKRIPSEDLAMAMLALLKKVRAAEAAHAGANNWGDIIEKLKEKDNSWKGPYVTPTAPYQPSPYPSSPQWAPPQGPTWIDDHTSGTLPNDGVTYTSSAGNYSDGRGLYAGLKGHFQHDKLKDNPGKSKTNP